MLRCFVFFFLFSSVLSAQSIDYFSYHIDTNEGLPDKEIYKIIEDNDGFLWIATNSGLFRYDGLNFKLYKHNSQSKSSVFGLIIDSENRLWFNTINGEYFYVQNDQVHLFGDYAPLTNEILRPFNVIENTLYISFNDRIICVDVKSKNVKTIHLLNNVQTSVSAVNNFKNRKYVVDSKQFFDIEAEEVIINNDYRISSHTIATESGIIVHRTANGNQNQFKLVNKSHSIPLKGLKDILNTTFHGFKLLEGYLWIFTSRGAFQYDIKNIEDCRLTNVFLDGKDVTDALIDSHNNIIFSTLNYGLYVLPDLSLRRIKRSSTDKYISDFEPINDTLVTYIEGQKSLVSINTKNSESKEIELENFNQKLFYNKYANTLYVFINDKMHIYKNDTHLAFQKTISLGKPKDIIKLGNDTLLLSHYNKLKTVEALTFKENNYFLGRCDKLAYNSNSKLLYVGFSKGLKIGNSIEVLEDVYYEDSKIFIKDITNRPLSSDTYVLTHDNEIIKIVNDKPIVKIDLPSQYKFTTVASTKDVLWIGSDKGIINYNYKSKKITILRDVAAIQVNDIKLTDTKVWISTDTDLLEIPKNYKPKLDSTLSKPYFYKISVNGKSYDPKETILISDKNQTVSTTFLVNGVNNNKNYKFEYKIGKGKWQPVEINELVLTGIPYGEQKLKLRAKHKDNLKVSETSVLKLKTLRPFYAKWWFIGIVCLIVFFIIYRSIRYSIDVQYRKKRKELQQMEIKREMTKLQLENLRSQMNPHFIFNALNSIQEYIFANEKKLASSYLVKFSRLIRIYLDQSRLSEITLAKEIEALNLYLNLENNRFGNLINYKLHVDKELNADTILVPSLFIQPYVENAIKHGLLHKKDEKHLFVKFNKNSKHNSVEVSIEDNGIGRKASIKHNKNRPYKSFSTEASLNRVVLLNQKRHSKIEVKIIDKTNEKGKALGTKVLITIPLN